jgi:hypothetical protein
MSEVVTINLLHRLAGFSDGNLSAFIKMFDLFGEETEDSENAVSAITETPDGGWW